MKKLLLFFSLLAFCLQTRAQQHYVGGELGYSIFSTRPILSTLHAQETVKAGFNYEYKTPKKIFLGIDLLYNQQLHIPFKIGFKIGKKKIGGFLATGVSTSFVIQKAPEKILVNLSWLVETGIEFRLHRRIHLFIKITIANTMMPMFMNEWLLSNRAILFSNFSFSIGYKSTFI
jgi:hypothetical protein